MDEPTQELVTQLEIDLKQLAQKNARLQQQVDRANLLHDVSVSLSTALDFETIVTKAVNFAQHLGATSGEIHLLTDAGDVYFKSTYPERNNLDDAARRSLVERVLNEGLDAWTLQTNQLALVLDTRADDRWLNIKHADATIEVRSAICAPIKISRGRLRGAISFVHPAVQHFDEQDLNLLGALTAHITTALENAYQVTDIKDSLSEARLMIDISRQMSGTSNLRSVHSALQYSVATIGADVCAMLSCYGTSPHNLPTHAEVSLVGSVKSPQPKHRLTKHQLALSEYPALAELVATQNILVVENLDPDERLSTADRNLLRQLGANSVVVYPLIQRAHVVGILAMGHKHHHVFNERELALYQTLANQTTLAMEHVSQIQRTEDALAETQTLYRAGRVLAAAGAVQQVLQEALVEFVYSLGLQQGAVVQLADDRHFGELAVYMDQGDVQPPEQHQFRLDRNNPAHQSMLAGQPFVATNPTDAALLAEFGQVKLAKPLFAALQAPMIMGGETIGWLTAAATDDQRHFSQREIDLARAMADQVTIAIQNRRLLEQTERRAEQLRAVATVGEAVTGQTDLGEVLKLTVNLIRDRFGFYHVSIFLIDGRREWAVVKASTGEVGKIMVERPHRLAVGSNSIVGFVTYHAQPRIALDVGKDAVHFNNPLLPDTRSEMALPLISRGAAIGALDVQSTTANAFINEDIETLQIMADQITTAIETARLFEETQRRLQEQAMLYRIGTRIGGVLNLNQTASTLVTETAEMLNVARCALALLEAGDSIYTISDHTRPNSAFKSEAGRHTFTAGFDNLLKMMATKQEVTIYADDDTAAGREFDYLTAHHGTAMILVPILLRNDIIGVLELYDDLPDRRFTQSDISLLDSVALLAANAIENARLFEAVRESQTFMKSIINQLPDPIFIKDRKHRWVVVNTSFAQSIFGQSEEALLGKTDHDFLPVDEADFFWEQDDKVFTTGQPVETEETITDAAGNILVLYTRKIPLTLSPNQTTPEYLVGIIQDITRLKRREVEREQLINDTRRTLERTQTLFRISAALGTATERRRTFEIVLGEYLSLLGLQQGTIMLFNQAANSNIAEARFIAGEPVPPQLILPLNDDRIFKHLRQNPKPLLIDAAADSPLVKSAGDTRGQQQVTHMLALPLLIRGKLVGNIIIDATNPDQVFVDEDVEIGQAIAEMLAIWLENRHLLEEAQYRSISLQTASEVSRAASSILNINELIENSVNLIRSHFDFYYVGIFLLDESGEWAVLKAGTGEAGRIQLANNHKLKVGGESMIGWSVAQRKARIALDVGEEAVRFRNPHLPETRSEMALPLISRDEVLGAVTVQSTRRLAFSDEDITLLQTMADQLANAIKNADLFTQSQAALAEAESMYQLTQAISSARDEATVYQLAIDSLAKTGVDSAAIFIYIQSPQPDNTNPYLEQKAVWIAGGTPAFTPNARIKAADFIFEQALPLQGWFLLDDVATDPRVTDQMRQTLATAGISALLVMPLSTHQERLGYFLATYRDSRKKFSPSQIRFFTTVAKHMIVTLENIRLLDDSQKRARREEIIRDITTKIRNATDVNDIMKTTITELGKVIGTASGRITLELPAKTTGNARTNGDKLP